MPQIRDLTVVTLPNEQFLLTAVDISAGFGEKEHDGLRVSPELTGKLTTRVAMLEMLASGAEVVAISDVVGAEMEPTGRRVIAGIQQELIQANLAHLELNGSTEENMKTSQTSVGVMITGMASAAQLKINNVTTDAILFAYGEPRVGQEILDKPDLDVSYRLVRELVKRHDVLELVPVGSKGIRFEATQLAELNDCTYIEQAECPSDWLRKSAGPATVILIAVKIDDADTFSNMYSSVYKLGTLVKK